MCQVCTAPIGKAFRPAQPSNHAVYLSLRSDRLVRPPRTANLALCRSCPSMSILMRLGGF